MKNLERASFDALEMLRRSHNKWKFHKKTKKYALFFFFIFFFYSCHCDHQGDGGVVSGTGDRSGLWIGNVALLDGRLTIRMTAHIAPILFIAKPTKNLIKIQWIFSDLDRLMRVVLTLHRVLCMHI